MSKEQQQNQPQPITLTTISLVKYTIMSAVFAIFILLTIVLPAEYNIDPTGAGKYLGLTKLSENTVGSTNSVVEQENTRENTALIQLSQREDTVKVSIPAGRGIEYKFNLNQYGRLKYEWSTLDESDLYFDFHGEPKGDKTGFFESYTIATSNKMNGTMTVPFDGIHGWYWKNTSKKDITVNLITSGQYTVLGLKK